MILGLQWESQVTTQTLTYPVTIIVDPADKIMDRPKDAVQRALRFEPHLEKLAHFNQDGRLRQHSFSLTKMICGKPINTSSRNLKMTWAQKVNRSQTERDAKK